MARMLHSLILTFLALMQCIAPIAHAHVDGHNADHGAHIGISVSIIVASTDHYDAVSASSPHSIEAIISMPPEHNSDRSIHPAHTSQQDFSFPAPPVDISCATYIQPDALLKPASTYTSPFGQAPPV